MQVRASSSGSGGPRVFGRCVPARDIEGLLERLRTQHAEGRVLIVSHALTIPHLLKAFGHPEEVMPDPKVYDPLYMIVPKPTGPPLVVVLRYSGG